MYHHSALLPWRIEDEFHAFQKKILDTNSENFAHSHTPREENEHHKTLFIYVQ
jgi:hypothetical protein